MSLEEKAKNAIQKLGQIEIEANMLIHLLQRVMEKVGFDGQQIGFSAEDKQKIITWYQTKKVELIALVDELP